MLHGRQAADDAAETARRTFEEGALGDDLPTVEIAGSELDAGMGVLGAFVAAGLAGSNGEMRRHVKGGAVKVNDATVTDDRATLTRTDVSAEGVIKLSLGKKKHALIRPV
ncbi:MAG: tyrosine--tRNA ligase, partial [Notoacmeibacter sp.]|nr:tyrosine--tRNA ligase [Notoacmeibacter sp.]